MYEALFVIGTAILGAIVGAIATYYFQERRATRERRERKDRIRIVLSFEMERNLDDLKDFWQKVLAEINKKDDPAKEDEQKAFRLSFYPLPTFTHIAWESLATEFPEALTGDEFKDGNRHHSLLQTLSNAHKYLEEHRTEADGLTREQKKDKNLPWKKYSPSQWTEFERAVDRVLEIGNPLAD